VKSSRFSASKPHKPTPWFLRWPILVFLIAIIVVYFRKVLRAAGASWKVASPFVLLDGKPAERQLRLC
jgi:hypothetical protein